MSEIEMNVQAAQPVLMIRTNTPVEELPKLIGESYMKMMAYLNELGEAPVGAPYTAYYNMDMQNLDVEMGFPVSKRLPDKGEMKAGELPEGEVASIMYKGPYGKMEAVYGDLFEWIEENGYDSALPYYEYYYNSPDQVPESELLTSIAVPIKEKVSQS